MSTTMTAAKKTGRSALHLLDPSPNSRWHRWRPVSLFITGLYLAVALGLRLLGDLLCFVANGHRTNATVGQTLGLPIRLVQNWSNPKSIWGSTVAEQITFAPLAFAALAVTALLSYLLLLRHDHVRLPWEPKKDEDDESEERRNLRPDIKKVGIASQKNPTGLLVPVNAEQPANRQLLGSYTHRHLLRDKHYNVYAQANWHTLLFGPSGAGKGAAGMLPPLLSHGGAPDPGLDNHGRGWEGPMISATVKADHVQATLNWRLQLSDYVRIYDPSGMCANQAGYSGYRVGWNPLSMVTDWARAQQVAALFIIAAQGSTSQTSNSEYFANSGEMALAPLLLAASMGALPFRQVCAWAINPDDTGTEGEGGTLAEVSDILAGTGEVDALNALDELVSIYSKADQERSGVWGTVNTALKAFRDKTILDSTDPDLCAEMLDLDRLLTTPQGTLYVVAPDVARESRRLRPVFAAFMSLVVEEAQKLARLSPNGELPMPVLALWDEVKNFGAIPDLARILSLTRSARFFVRHGWQDTAQMEGAYSKDEAKTITSNSQAWMVYPGVDDSDELERLAKLLGERRTKKVSKSKRRGEDKADSENESTERIKRATAASIRTMSSDELLIVAGNLPPFVIKQHRFYQDPIMSARSGSTVTKRRLHQRTAQAVQGTAKWLRDK